MHKNPLKDLETHGFDQGGIRITLVKYNLKYAWLMRFFQKGNFLLSFFLHFLLSWKFFYYL